MHFVARRVFDLILAAVLAYFIALAGQGIWTGLLNANLATTPAIPWSVALTGALLWGIWRYLDGWGWPSRTADTRHHYLRANRLPLNVFGWAVLAGSFSVIGLAGIWMMMAKVVRLPGNGLVDVSGIPPVTAALAIGMGSLISPVLEQAGFFGYGQRYLEQRFSKTAAVMIISLIYAFGPHPPAGSPLWPRLVFYFLIGLVFALLAALTDSILPGLIVHILGILAFFTLVWPYDPARMLISQSGLDALFWVYLVQAVLFTGLAITAFGKLIKKRNTASAVSPSM